MSAVAYPKLAETGFGETTTPAACQFDASPNATSGSTAATSMVLGVIHQG